MLCASDSLLLLMDRSASIRVAPEPCRSGDIEISDDPRRRTVAIPPETLAVAGDAFKIEDLTGAGLHSHIFHL
jgi:hypothetical protein